MEEQSGTESMKTESINNQVKETPSRQKNSIFPIVGIGSSAGGLEALERFLRNVTAESGMAFVIVQHLDPTHKGIMVELLQHATPMPVSEVKDGMKVEPNRVYLIPPNKDMSLLHGVLHLFNPVAPRGLRLPIDFFFRSLADDLQERSIGVILSGMGSDGTLGLRSIKEKAGGIFVQEPATAKFDGMPRSAIEAGLADVVAPVEELPGKIIAFLQHTHLISKAGLHLVSKAETALEKIVILLRAKTGHDFSMYKKSTLYRRVERRMGIHQIDRISIYVRFLQKNPQEVELLFRELLIGVTRFFRDPAAWELLKEMPSRRSWRTANPASRFGPGCPAAQQGRGLFLSHRLQRALDHVKPGGNFQLHIFATDLDQDSIDKARMGFYPDNIAADVSSERLRRFLLRKKMATGSAKRSAKWLFLPRRTSSWTRPSPGSTSCPAGTC